MYVTAAHTRNVALAVVVETLLFHSMVIIDHYIGNDCTKLILRYRVCSGVMHDCYSMFVLTDCGGT